MNIDDLINDIYEISVSQKTKDDALEAIQQYLLSCESFGIKKCRQCDTIFIRITKWQKYCCEDCKLLFFEIKHGKKFSPGHFQNYIKKENGLRAVHLSKGILVTKKK